MVPAHTVGFSSPAALRPTICGLLYRLLIICAHLQRHSAIGYLLPLADLMLSAPSVPASFDRATHRLFFPFDPSLSSSRDFFSPFSSRRYVRAPISFYREPLQLSGRKSFSRNLFGARIRSSPFEPLDQSARRMSAIRKAIKRIIQYVHL